jgi:hypothetical protein
VKDVENHLKVRGVVEKVNLGSVLVLEETVVEPLAHTKVLVGILFLIDSEDLGVGRRELSHVLFPWADYSDSAFVVNPKLVEAALGATATLMGDDVTTGA